MYLWTVTSKYYSIKQPKIILVIGSYGEAQNIGANPINNVMVVWHLYDAFGNIVGLTQGTTIPSILGTGQTTIFNLQENPASLTGVPKFYRISFVF